jgi:hypothetical protein
MDSRADLLEGFLLWYFRRTFCTMLVREAMGMLPHNHTMAPAIVAGLGKKTLVVGPLQAYMVL